MKLRFVITIALLLSGITSAHGQEDSARDRLKRMADSNTVTIDSAVKDTAGVVIQSAEKLPNKDTVFSTIKETASDTLPPKKLPFEPNAKRAGMYSSILPGLGQTYNRQYWKVPVVYAILGAAGYFINFNYNRYSDYRQAYILAIDGNPETESIKYALYDAPQLKRLQDDAKRDLDIVVLLTSVGYALQIMDAVASAHLKNFDISRDISMQVKPVMQNNFIGMGLVVNFK